MIITTINHHHPIKKNFKNEITGTYHLKELEKPFFFSFSFFFFLREMDMLRQHIEYFIKILNYIYTALIIL